MNTATEKLISAEIVEITFDAFSPLAGKTVMAVKIVREITNYFHVDYSRQMKSETYQDTTYSYGGMFYGPENLVNA